MDFFDLQDYGTISKEEVADAAILTSFKTRLDKTLMNYGDAIRDATQLRAALRAAAFTGS